MSPVYLILHTGFKTQTKRNQPPKNNNSNHTDFSIKTFSSLCTLPQDVQGHSEGLRAAGVLRRRLRPGAEHQRADVQEGSARRADRSIVLRFGTDCVVLKVTVQMNRTIFCGAPRLV